MAFGHKISGERLSAESCAAPRRGIVHKIFDVICIVFFMTIMGAISILCAICIGKAVPSLLVGHKIFINTFVILICSAEITAFLLAVIFLTKEELLDK